MNPDNFLEGFPKITTIDELANFFEVDPSKIVKYARTDSGRKNYVDFVIPKKSQGERLISAPVKELKLLQLKIAAKLTDMYRPRASAYGYVKNKNIVIHAEKHKQKQFVLNIDIESFFPSISHRRVSSLLVGYGLSPKFARIISLICCFHERSGKTGLPQGSPASPVLSNMVCSKLDSDLERFAISNKLYYTRYVDDMTFSCTRNPFPANVAKIEVDGETSVSEALESIFAKHGFKIKNKKSRLQFRKRRQEVNGLVVNEKVNVKFTVTQKIRLMISTWENHTIEIAASKFITEIASLEYKIQKFKSVLKGYISFYGQVRGFDDQKYLKFYLRLRKKDPKIAKKSLKNIFYECRKDKEYMVYLDACLTSAKIAKNYFDFFHLSLLAFQFCKNAQDCFYFDNEKIWLNDNRGLEKFDTTNIIAQYAYEDKTRLKFEIDKYLSKYEIDKRPFKNLDKKGVFMSIREGLRRVSKRADGTEWKVEFDTLRMRIERNIERIQIIGSNPTTQGEEAEIVNSLNKLCYEKIGKTFTEFCFDVQKEGNVILFLASQPNNEKGLNIDDEFSSITDIIAKSKGKFIVKDNFRLKGLELNKSIVDNQPKILHFSGHGETEGLILEDISNNSFTADTNAITTILRLSGLNLECVVLNSCYSEIQAKEISLYVPFVVGSSFETPNNVAISFSKSFYQALCDGKNYRNAFDFAISQLKLSFPSENNPYVAFES